MVVVFFCCPNNNWRLVCDVWDERRRNIPLFDSMMCVRIFYDSPMKKLCWSKREELIEFLFNLNSRMNRIREGNELY